MSENNTSPTIFVRENTLMPAGLGIESEPFLPGWRAVKNLNGRELGRKIESAKWNYFYLAGPIRTTVIGREGWATLRTALKRVLAKQQTQNYNSLEITKVTPRRVLGVPFLSISAHSRHIQEGMDLVPTEDFRLKEAADLPTTPLATIVFGSAEKVHQE
jgi:hypothetical protein